MSAPPSFGPNSVESAPLLQSTSAFFRSANTTVGILKVKVTACKELPPEGLFHQLDPFVKLTCGTQAMTYPKGSGVSPTWPNAETFVIDLKGEETKMLHIEVIDARKLLSNHKLADAFIPIRKLIFDGQGSHWHELIKDGLPSISKIQLDVIYTPPLYVNVLKIKGVPNPLCCGSLHSFVRMQWDLKGFDKFKRTPTHPNGDVEWKDENQFIFNTPELERHDSKLTLEVVHEGTFSNDLLCSTSIQFSKIKEHAHQHLVTELPLHRNTQPAGSIFLLFEIQ